MADKSMKEYTDALIVLNETAKAIAKGNKLVKIAVKTEDDAFKTLLNEAIKAYGYYIERSYSRTVPEGSDIPRNSKEYVEYLAPRKKALTEYIENILAEQKPQWQILAERNGWTKPC